MNRLPILIFLLLIVAILVATGIAGFCQSERIDDTGKPEEKTPKAAKEVVEKWGNEQLVMEGTYMDADVVAIENGPMLDSGEARFRVYYVLGSEGDDFESSINSAVSVDGANWTEEEGTRMSTAKFPSVIRLPDGSWRMYCRGIPVDGHYQVGIVSAVSDDGLNWTEEPGFRVRPGQQGEFDTEDIAAPAVAISANNKYLMVYRGSSGQNKYGQKDPATGEVLPIDYLISATSEDGLNWTIQHVVVNGRNEDMRDKIDGPDLVIDGDKIKLYCSSYEGIYTLNLTEEGKSINTPQVVLKATGQEIAPGDVSVIKTDSTWRMYFVLPAKGIYMATRDD